MPFQKNRTLKCLILYEVKKEVSYNISTLDEKSLAQTIVEGFYLMMGEGCDSIVVGLTNIAVTHYFGLKLPSTRASSQDRSLEVAWHHQIAFENYPLEVVDQLNPFILFIHKVLDEANP